MPVLVRITDYQYAEYRKAEEQGFGTIVKALFHFILRARDLHPGLGRFLSADPVQPNAPGTQGYNRYAYVANNPTTWVDPSGYSVEPLAADLALLGMMYAMRGGLSRILRCALDEECRAMKALMGKLGSHGANYVEWTADKLYDVFFAYPQRPTPVDPGLILLSVGMSNVPIWGDLYDLYSGVTGYDPITKQYLAGWERLTNILGVIPFPGVTGSNIRHGVDAIESLIDKGDELAQFIGKTCSFGEDTPVATDEGAVPIREVDVGDRVLAWNETVGETGYYTVTAVWGHEDPVTVQLVVNGETIETTPEHPFLTANGNWVAAGELQVGDKIRNADDENGVVEAVEFVAVPQVMYNMTIADAHTYTVGDGEWVVHNACRVAYGNLDGFSRPTGIIAELSSPLPRGTKPNPRILPPGWGSVYNNKARGHLLANVLGGSGDDKRNLVTIVQIPINTPEMRGIERSIRNAVNAGETILYQVTPIYRGSDLIPMGITIEAIGDQGFELALTLLNRFR